jgi:hypothetical protein
MSFPWPADGDASNLPTDPSDFDSALSIGLRVSAKSSLAKSSSVRRISNGFLQQVIDYQWFAN